MFVKATEMILDGRSSRNIMCMNKRRFTVKNTTVCIYVSSDCRTHTTNNLSVTSISFFFLPLPNVYRMRGPSFHLTNPAYYPQTDVKRTLDRITFLRLPSPVGNHHCYGTLIVQLPIRAAHDQHNNPRRRDITPLIVNFPSRRKSS